MELSRVKVHRHLHHMGYKNMLPQRNPMLTTGQRTRRLEWVIAHGNDDWSQTIFSDETWIQLFRNTVRRWTKNGRDETKRVSKGRQIIVWGAISSRGTIGLCLFKGIMDARRYVNILEKNLLPAAGRHFGDDWRLQQDNDPRHTVRFTNQFLSSNVPLVIYWPAYSP